MRNLNVSIQFFHIVDAQLATQHARCHKEYYSPRGQAVSTSHVLGGDSRQRSQFAILSTISSQERLVFSKFHDFHVPRLHHGETCLQLKLFAQPMDRAEVLHAPRYDISGSWKNTPDENELVLPCENSTVHPKLATRGRPSTMVSAGWTRREGVSIANNSTK